MVSSTESVEMKIAVVIVRSLMGLLLLSASVTYFLGLTPETELQGAMKTFNDGIAASVYLLPTAKAIEFLCGLLFLVGRFVPLATILIAPIIVNIFLINAFMLPENLPIAGFLVVANAFVAYFHRDAYAPLFRA